MFCCKTISFKKKVFAETDHRPDDIMVEHKGAEVQLGPPKHFETKEPEDLER